MKDVLSFKKKKCIEYPYIVLLPIYFIQLIQKMITHFRRYRVWQSQFESKYMGHGLSDSPRHVRHGLQFERHVKTYSYARLRNWTM